MTALRLRLAQGARRQIGASELHMKTGVAAVLDRTEIRRIDARKNRPKNRPSLRADVREKSLAQGSETQGAPTLLMLRLAFNFSDCHGTF